MTSLTRRQCLTLAAAGAGCGVLGAAPRSATALGRQVQLAVQTRVIDVNGRPATVHCIRQPSGQDGLTLDLDDRFQVRMKNELATDTLVCWHGLTPPSSQAGVPNLSRPALGPGQSYDYDFAIRQSGTHWMSSLQGLQRQKLTTAPLIVRDPQDRYGDVQDIVLVLSDFTFREPEEVLSDLKRGVLRPMAVNHEEGEGSGQTAISTGERGSMFHFHDVRFDAYLANDRTLRDPEVVPVDRGQTVRLRIINASSATNFLIDLGYLQGTLIAVDGSPIVPLRAIRFPIATAQRLDIQLTLPREEGAFPVLAQRENDISRTGIVLATPRGSVSRISETAQRPTPGLPVERPLRAAIPLPVRPPDRTNTYNLTGSHDGHNWSVNMRTYDPGRPFWVKEGERVEIVLNNLTTMPHPMHLHGHKFQVVSVSGERISGAIRDTVMVPPHQSVRIAFDADNPGQWVFHSQHLYHMAVGMMTSIRYRT